MAEVENQKTIRKKIDEIAAIANELPGVVVIHNAKNLVVEYMNKMGLENINAKMEDLRAMGKMGRDYHDRYFNAEDARDYSPKIFEVVASKDDSAFVTFFQQVKTSTTKMYEWYLSSMKVLLRDDKGDALLTITMAYKIDPIHHLTSKVSRLLQDNNFLKQNYERFAKLTRRESEVLKFMVMGMTSTEISEQLFISVQTVETHRKNIKRKLHINSSFDLAQYARAFDLID